MSAERYFKNGMYYAVHSPEPVEVEYTAWYEVEPSGTVSLVDVSAATQENANAIPDDWLEMERRELESLMPHPYANDCEWQEKELYWAGFYPAPQF